MAGRPSCTACNGSGRVAGAECVRCADVIEQARDWLLLKCPASVSGNGGHNAAFAAASVIVGGFGLSGAVAEQLFAEWNTRCAPPWSEREMAHKLRSAERGSDKPAGFLIWKRADGSYEPGRDWHFKPKADEDLKREKYLEAKAVPFDRSVLEKFRLPGVDVSPVYLRERSAIDPKRVGPELFFEALYEKGERVIVFTSFRSQGEFCYEVGSGWWKLGHQPGVASERIKATDIKLSWREGVWFLSQPVDARWKADGEHKDGRPKFTRRSGANVTDWRYMVVESDEKGIEDLWLHAVVQFPLPIVALYTSGDRSVHALIRVDAESKQGWDEWRDKLRPFLTKIGADKGVFSAVRLTRLPGFRREGKEGKEGYIKFESPRLQALLYFNPTAGLKPICTLDRQRDLTTERQHV